MATIKRFNIKKLQKDFKYTNLILEKVIDMLVDKEKSMKKNEYVYELHYTTYTIINLIKPYLSKGFLFRDAYDLALQEFQK